MRRVTVIENITLDGVMQAPARPDEDDRGGFPHGGWALPYGDEVIARGLLRRLAESPRQPVHRGAQPHSQVRRVHHAQFGGHMAQLHAD
jgi:hypothetical protein